MMIQNLLFDLDGTLIDSSEGVVAAINYALAQTGSPPQEADRIKNYIGYPLEQTFADFTQASFADLYHHFQIMASSSVVASAIMLDGADESLRALQERGYRMAVASTKVSAHIRGIVQKFGWQDLFEVTVGGDEVARVKPDPGIFSLALERLGGTAEDSIVIGDTVNDLLAARALELPCVYLRSPFGGLHDVLQLEPDFVIDTLPQLVELLDLIELQTNQE